MDDDRIATLTRVVRAGDRRAFRALALTLDARLAESGTPEDGASAARRLVRRSRCIRSGRFAHQMWW
ncbi:MAG TPA: hypothetical protein VFJ85_12100 [Acidimicrobiales bacterium]|nr:hypothetical protein [Acidimicrobiales bacterium]